MKIEGERKVREGERRGDMKKDRRGMQGKRKRTHTKINVSNAHTHTHTHTHRHVFLYMYEGLRRFPMQPCIPDIHTNICLALTEENIYLPSGGRVNAAPLSLSLSIMAGGCCCSVNYIQDSKSVFMEPPPISAVMRNTLIL